MKRILSVLLAVLLVISCTSCTKKSVDAEEAEANAKAISEGVFDWDAAREKCISDISDVLKVILAGDANTYASTRNLWMARVEPTAQISMFPSTPPPQNCSAVATFWGYSAPEYNSENAEYLIFNARCMDNQTLAAADYRIVIKLSRGNTGYIISEFIKEAMFV